MAVDGQCIRTCNVQENCDVGEQCLDGACRPASTTMTSSGGVSLGSGASSQTSVGASSASRVSSAGSVVSSGNTSGAASSNTGASSSTTATSNPVGSSAGTSAAGSSLGGSSLAASSRTSSAGASSTGAASSSAGGTSASSSAVVSSSSRGVSSSLVPFSSSTTTTPSGTSSTGGGGTTSSSTSTGGATTGGSTGGPLVPTLLAIQPSEVLQHDAPGRLYLLATNVGTTCEVRVGLEVVDCEVDGMGLFVTLTPAMVATPGQASVAVRELGGSFSNDLPLTVRPSGASSQWWISGLDGGLGLVLVQLFNPFPRDATVTLLHVLSGGGQVSHTVLVPASSVLDVDVLGPAPGRGSSGVGALAVTSTVPIVAAGTVTSPSITTGVALFSARSLTSGVTVGSRNTSSSLARSFYLFNPTQTEENITLRAFNGTVAADTLLTLPPMGVLRHDVGLDVVLANGVFTLVLADGPVVVNALTRDVDDMLAFHPQATPVVDAWLVPLSGSETGIRVSAVNPGTTDATVTVTGYELDGWSNTLNFTVPAGTQRVQSVATPLALTGDLVLHVVSSAPVHLWADQSRNADNCLVQPTVPARDVLVGGLRTTGGTARVLVFNPTVGTATVQGLAAVVGAAPTPVGATTVPPNTTLVLDLGTVVGTSGEVAVRLEADVPVVFGGVRTHTTGLMRCPATVVP